MSLDGALADLRRGPVRAPAGARTEVALFERGEHDPTRGLWIARAPGRDDIAPAIFRAGDYAQAAALPTRGWHGPCSPPARARPACR